MLRDIRKLKTNTIDAAIAKGTIGQFAKVSKRNMSHKKIPIFSRAPMVLTAAYRPHSFIARASRLENVFFLFRYQVIVTAMLNEIRRACNKLKSKKLCSNVRMPPSIMKPIAPIAAK